MKNRFLLFILILLVIPLNVSAESLVTRMEIGEKIACPYDFYIQAMSNGVMSDLGISAERKNDINFHVAVVLTLEKISDSSGGTFKVVSFYNNSSTDQEFNSRNLDAYFNGNKVYPSVKNNIYDLIFDHSEENICNNLGLLDAGKCTNGKVYSTSTSECPIIYYNPISGLISTSLDSNYSGVSYSSNLKDRICISYKDSTDKDDDELLTEHICAYTAISSGHTYIEKEDEPIDTVEPDQVLPVCEAIPDEIINYLKEALKLIRWLGLVLMIVLGTLDFVKAAAADDQDAMKKASQNFIKRLIAVIILFLLPIIIELILSILSMIGFDFAKCENYHIINF